MRRACPALAAAAAVLIAGTLVPTHGAAPARATTAVAADGIDATGATDVTDMLNDLFTRLAPGTTVELAPEGRYLVDGVLDLRGLRDVTIAGNGATIFAITAGAGGEAPRRALRANWPRLRRHVSLTNVERVTITDLVVEGPNADGRYAEDLEGQAAFTVVRSRDVVLDAVTARRVHGDGVYVAGKSEGVTVRDSTFERIGRQGVAVVDGREVVIENNRFDQIRRSVIDVEPAGRHAVEGVTIRGNEIGDYANFLLAAGGQGENVRDLTLHDNRVEGGNGISVFAGIERWRRTGLAITDNVSTATAGADGREGRPGIIQIAMYDDVTITGNTSPVDDGASVVSLDRVCRATIDDNEWLGAANEVVEVAPCEGDAGSAARAGSGSAEPSDPTEQDDATAPQAARSQGDADADSPWPFVGGLALGTVFGAALALLWTRGRQR